jgi:hypothetical protein
LRQFASPGFRIWNLSREAKLVYTGFGLFSLLAITVSGLLYDDMVGGERSVRGYYAGDASAAPPSRSPSLGGPKIDLPEGDGAAAAIAVAIPYRKLLEVTHFHLFTVPVFLLIVAHLFMLTGLSPRAKSIWIVLAFAASLSHLAAPWLIRYGGASLAPTYGISGALMGVTVGFLTVYPMVVMWLRRPDRGE